MCLGGQAIPVATIDRLQVDYVVKGDGRPLSMLAAGEFDSTIESWWMRSVLESVAAVDNSLVAA